MPVGGSIPDVETKPTAPQLSAEEEEGLAMVNKMLNRAQRARNVQKKVNI